MSRRRVLPLADCCTLLTDGTHYTPTPVDEGIPFLTVKDMTESGLDFGRCSRMGPAAFELARKANCSPQQGDVLFSKDGTVGKVHAVGDSRPFAVLSSIAILRPDPSVLDSRFLGHVLRSPQALAEAGQRKTGSALRRIVLSDLATLRVPVPPLPEQRRIAAVLDKADAIRRKRQQATRLADDLLRSAFLDMFGDPVTNPRGWPAATLGEIASEKGAIVDGPFGSSLKPECYVGSGVVVVRNFNIVDDRFDGSAFKYVTPSKFEEIRRSEVLPGDVLISTKGTIGNACLMPDLRGPAVLSASGTVRIRVSREGRIRPQFLVSEMIDARYKTYLRSLEAGSNQKYLNLTAIRSARLAVPPLALQDRFLGFRGRLHAIGANLAVGRTASDHLFHALVQSAFQGDM